MSGRYCIFLVPQIFEEYGSLKKMNQDPPVDSRDANAEVWELIRTLVLGSVPPNRILELFYWAQEPGVLEVVRTFLALKPEQRAVLHTFLEANHAKSIVIEADRSNRIILTARQPTEVAPVPGEQEKDVFSEKKRRGRSPGRRKP